MYFFVFDGDSKPTKVWCWCTGSAGCWPSRTAVTEYCNQTVRKDWGMSIFSPIFLFMKERLCSLCNPFVMSQVFCRRLSLRHGPRPPSLILQWILHWCLVTRSRSQMTSRLLLKINSLTLLSQIPIPHLKTSHFCVPFKEVLPVFCDECFPYSNFWSQSFTSLLREHSSSCRK